MGREKNIKKQRRKLREYILNNPGGRLDLVEYLRLKPFCGRKWARVQTEFEQALRASFNSRTIRKDVL
jgi:hypothetical protein